MIPLAGVARSMYAAAVAAVQPAELLRRLRGTDRGFGFEEEVLEPAGRLAIVALGKAAPGLATACLARAVRRPDLTFVLAPTSAAVPAAVAPFTRLAGHPVPDAAGQAATRELLSLLAGLGPADGVLVLLSGGASALLAEPLPGLALATLAAGTRALLAGGASIAELNTVRKHTLAAAGGRLAATCPAALLTLVLSDVPGDDLGTVGSAPTGPDDTTAADALAVLARRGLAGELADLERFLAHGGESGVRRPVRSGDPRLARSRVRLLGSSRDALEAAGRVARQAGLAPRVLTRTMRGEASRLGATLSALACALAPGEGAALLLAGETTVRVRGAGTGGRNLEAALTAAALLAGVPERCVLLAGTDGADGTAPAAGAVVDGGTLARALAGGRDPEAALAANDSWGFFSGLPEAITPGPTGTNVADLAFVLAAGAVPGFLAEVAAQSLALPLQPPAVLRRRL